MASVWKRLQRVNKRAAKFQYTASYHRVDLETSPKWKPNKLSIVWTRRSRRVITEPLEWEPSLKDPLKGSVIYPVPENQTVTVTLFKDSRTNELEDKDWTFVLEDVSATGKRRRLAVASINMRRYASLEPSQRALCVPLDPTTHKVLGASVHLTLHCVLLREGQATDEDMQSLASLFSVNNNSDIAVLEELDEDWLSDNSTRQMSDLRQQMEEMTQSLSSDVCATPNSVQSLAMDPRTPTAPTPASAELADTPTHADTQPKVDYQFEPKKFDQTSTPIDNLKEVVFKPTTVAKRKLKPLELKTNLNIIGLDRNDNEKEDSDKTPTADMEGLFPGKFHRDKTPVQDLLEWCQFVTREYKSCKVTNLTTSFRSGLAFCAIIHHYRPDLIDFSGLQPDEAEKNVRRALEASGALGISPVLSAAEVCRSAPDRLAIMTYLFQLRAHFTGSELQVEQLGNEETESSYLVGRHDTDGSLPTDLFSREISTRRSRHHPRPHHPAASSQESGERSISPEKRNSIVQQSRNILGRVLSAPSHEWAKPTAKWFDSQPGAEPIPAPPQKLMTRKELTDPFGSDDEDEEKNPPPQEPPKQDQKPATTEPAFLDPLNVLPNNELQREPQTNINLTENKGQEKTTENVNLKTENLTQNNDSKPLDNISNMFANGTNALAIGSSALANGSNALANGSNALSNGANALAKGSNSLANGSNSLAKGSNALANGSNSLSNGSNPLEVKATTPDLPKPTPQLLSRHDELKERARQLLEATKREAREKERSRRQREEKEERENGVRNGDLSPKKPMTEEERQTMLRERARKLIADARAGIVSPTSPLSPSRTVRPTVEIISKHSVMEEIAAAGGMEQLDALLARDADSGTPDSRKSLSPDRSESRNSEDSKSVKSAGSNEGRFTLQSFAALVDRLTPDKENVDDNETMESGSYIASELAALEREQRAIDQRAASLERQLRAVMDAKDNSEEEAHLMSQWFNLVNKKNALLRRQMQLNILEQEEDLSRRCSLLARELRLSLSLDEWRKTPQQKRRERLLLQELLSAVNERDRLVQEMDEQERAIADDDEIERNLSQVEMNRKNNCIIQ